MKWLWARVCSFCSFEISSQNVCESLLSYLPLFVHTLLCIHTSSQRQAQTAERNGSLWDTTCKIGRTHRGEQKSFLSVCSVFVDSDIFYIFFLSFLWIISLAYTSRYLFKSLVLHSSMSVDVKYLWEKMSFRIKTGIISQEEQITDFFSFSLGFYSYWEKRKAPVQ